MKEYEIPSDVLEKFSKTVKEKDIVDGQFNLRARVRGGVIVDWSIGYSTHHGSDIEE